jgi:hypothetical protein
MSWDVSIRRPDGKPLGRLDLLRRAFTESILGIQFYREPSGREKLAATQVDFPEVIRRFLESAPAAVQADFEEEGLVLRFSFGPEQQAEILRVDVEVRGNRDPLPILSGICLPNGWIVTGPDGRELDLSASPSPEWEQFAAWRDRAIETLKRPSPDGG